MSEGGASEKAREAGRASATPSAWDGSPWVDWSSLQEAKAESIDLANRILDAAHSESLGLERSVRLGAVPDLTADALWNVLRRHDISEAWSRRILAAFKTEVEREFGGPDA